MRFALATIVTLLAVPALATAQDSTPPAPPPPPVPVAPLKKQPNVITRAEIETIRDQVRNARDIVEFLRPQYLRVRVRGVQGNQDWAAGPRVVVDDVPYGDVESLRGIIAGAVREVRYISGPDAASRYGAEFNGGVILVLTR